MMQHYKPADSLNHLIKGYWLLEEPAPIGTAQHQYLFPSAAIEIVIHFQTPLTRVLKDGTFVLEQDCFIEGQQSGSLCVRQTSSLQCFGITLHPWAVFKLFHISPGELTDQRYSLSEIDPRLASLSDMLRSCNSPAEMTECCNRFFYEACRTDKKLKTSEERLIVLLCQADAETLGSLKNLWPYSTRLLEKKFSQTIGFPAARYYQKKKMVKVLKLLSSFENINGIHLACEADYYDQAHLIRHFQQYFQTTPGRFARENNQLIKAFY